jgi:hypothetical protein
LIGSSGWRQVEKPKIDIVSETSLDFFMTGDKEICYERKGAGAKKQLTDRMTAIAQRGAMGS